MKTIFVYAAIFGLFIYMAPCAKAQQTGKDSQVVTLVHDTSKLAAPVAYGLDKVKQALTSCGFDYIEVNTLPKQAKGTIIVTGIATGSKVVTTVLERSVVSAPSGPEALLIKRIGRKGKSLLVVTGADEVGTMYALLEVAAQISALPAGANIVTSIMEVTEKPYTRERSLSTYIYTEQVHTGFFHDPKYWDRLFEQVAESRFNSYDLIFRQAQPGTMNREQIYTNHIYAPPIYTLFFDVEGWTTEQVGGFLVSPEEQRRNLAALQSIVQKAHDHGIKLTLGIWNHVMYPRDAERLTPYTEAAIAKLIQLVPFDAFQFRMHGESGLPDNDKSLNAFWGRVFDGINKSGRHIRIYMRGKGLPNSVIEIARAKGMDFAIETKYSAEQFGMPFHPAHIQPANQRDRRHSYADLLSYPKRYDILWRLWNGGTQKLLLWGDTEYARRWIESTKLYDSGIFEIMEIEGAEIMGNGSKRALNDAYIYTDYEFQRYWCQNLIFGRIGFNPQTPDEVFEREFRNRFGNGAGHVVMQALAQASQILPRIIGSAMSDFSEHRGIAEWSSGSGGSSSKKALLSDYAKVNPCDVQTFMSFEEAAALLVEGGESARVWPQQNAEWFAKKAVAIRSLVEQSEAAIGTNRNKEFESTMTDLRILSAMAQFHSERIKAALSYNLFLRLNQSRSALDSAIKYETKALEAYRGAVAAAGDFYRTDLDVSVSGKVHWLEELALLENALEELKNTPATGIATMPALDFRDAADHEAPTVRHEPLASIEPSKPVTIRATITDPSGVKWARILYRGLTQFQDYQVVEMMRNGDTFTATIPATKLDEVTEYDAQTGAKWDFMYLIEVMDMKKNGCIRPDFEQTAPYVVVHLPHKTL